MTGFSVFGLPETLLTALDKIGFNEPTPIQAQAIPYAMKGQDVLGTASTGTGKTAAFALPMINHLLKSPKSVALVMTPTRELATQVLSTMEPLLLMHRDLHTACLIGGDSMGKQLGQLNRRPRLIVGTPGRINDHLSRGSLWLDRADFLVLDETDRMLDMGFGVQIEKIIVKMAKPRQTLMFSATLPKEIISMAQQYLKSPQRVSVGTINKPALNIKQVQVNTTEGEKYNELLDQLKAREGSVVVFVKTRHGAARLAKKLCGEQHGADAIHGDLQQKKRERVIQAFRDSKFRVLVATDVAARGLDIPHIAHVINYDLPQCPEDYIHRIGRTARAGALGEAVSLLTPADFAKWRAITKLISPEEDRNARASKSESSNSPYQNKKGPRKSSGAPFKGARDGRSRTNDDRRDDRRDGRRDERPEQRVERKAYGRSPFGSNERDQAPQPRRDSRYAEQRPSRGDERPRSNERNRGGERTEKVWNNYERPSEQQRARPAERNWGDRPRTDTRGGERDRSWGDRPRSADSRDARGPSRGPARGRPAAGKAAGAPRGGKPANGRPRWAA